MIRIFQPIQQRRETHLLNIFTLSALVFCNIQVKGTYLSSYVQNPSGLVIEECEEPKRASSDSYSNFASNALWIGHNKNKGLGVFAKPGIKIEKLAWESNSLRYFLPVRINHTFDLVAVWACKPYIEAFYEYERLHHRKIDRNTVILGDFNSNVVWDRLHGQRNHTTATRLLQERGLVSAYHYVTSEASGQESTPTFYMYRDKTKPHHIDYCFCSEARLKQMTVLNPDQFLAYSDHVPIAIEIN